MSYWPPTMSRFAGPGYALPIRRGGKCKAPYQGRCSVRAAQDVLQELARHSEQARRAATRTRDPGAPDAVDQTQAYFIH